MGLAWVNLTRRARPRTTGSPRKRQAKGRLSRNRPFSSALPHIVCVPGISKPFRPFVIPEPTPSAQHIGKQLPSVSAALMLPRPKGFGFNGLAILARQGEAFAPFLRGLIGVKYGKRTNPKGSLPLPDPENARRVFPVDCGEFHRYAASMGFPVCAQVRLGSSQLMSAPITRHPLRSLSLMARQIRLACSRAALNDKGSPSEQTK